MKKIVLIALLAFSFITVKAQYKHLGDSLHDLKKQGKFTGNTRLYNPNATKIQITNPQSHALKNSSTNNTIMGVTSTQCNCWVPRDTSFHPVPLNGSGTSTGPGSYPNYANDDWSTKGIALPFNFCFYGDTVGNGSDSLYINNNGNISFGAAYSTFSAVAFPSTDYRMIAPFWSDVDTDGPNSRYVWYKLTPTYLIIQWDSVGYFDSHDDKRNTYQLIISDGIDSILPNGYNVSFCYGDMQWTTGDASNGVNGFGGNPATVGINKGDSNNYFQLSLFNNNGNSYSTPSGNPTSGVNWLDYRSFMFSSCGTANNLPPLSINNDSTVCDTLTVYLVGDSAFIQRLSFIPPEINQSTTITAHSSDLGSSFSVIDSASGVVASLTFKIKSAGLVLGGYYHIAVISTDNGTPALSSTLNYVVYVSDTSHAIPMGIKTINDKQVSIYPNPSATNFVIETNSSTKQLMQVYDITGKVVLSQAIHNTSTIDVSGLNEGVYYISLTSTKGVVTKKLVIIK